jgi:hypothetical protein
MRDVYTQSCNGSANIINTHMPYIYIYRCIYANIDTRNSPGRPKVHDGGFVVCSDTGDGGRLSFHGIQELNRLNGMGVLPGIIHDGQDNAKDGHDRVATFGDG